MKLRLSHRERTQAATPTLLVYLPVCSCSSSIQQLSFLAIALTSTIFDVRSVVEQQQQTMKRSHRATFNLPSEPGPSHAKRGLVTPGGSKRAVP